LTQFLRTFGVISAVLASLSILGIVAAEQGGSSASQATPPPQASQPPQQKPVFRTGAELVRVDVAVLDRRGVPVPSLTANDFEVQEEGVLQEIQTFQFVKTEGHPDANDELSLPIRSRSHAATEAAKDNVRVFLIFWDEYHIGQVASATRARGSLMRFVRTAFGPTDIVAFMDPLTPVDALWFTRDRLELAEHVRRLAGRSGVYIPTRSAVEDAHLQRGDVERLRSEVTVSAVKSAAVHLGGLRDGRKTIILISEGLRGMMRDGQSLITDLIRTANDNNTAIFTVDPRGFGPQRFGSLFEAVAQDTGGQYFRSNDLDQALRQIVTQSGGFYLLGYSPSDRPVDGRFRKIRVRVKPSGFEVRARSGYWAPSAAEMERARTVAAAAEIPQDMRQALSELPGSNARRTIDLWVGTTLQDGRPAIRVAWVPRAAANGAAFKPAQVAAVATRGETKVFDGPVDAGGVSFAAPPGPMKITVTVKDSAGEVIDRDARTIDVPDAEAAALWISSPALFRSQNIREFRSLDRSPGAVPYAGREFARTDRLVVRLGVHGTLAANAKVTARLTSQWGKDLTELPLTRVSDADQYELDLPLTSVARGDFMIALTATAGETVARAIVPIRIVR
jgi:VWFA-related protein